VLQADQAGSPEAFTAAAAVGQVADAIVGLDAIGR
jgi:hypothetical protein